MVFLKEYILSCHPEPSGGISLVSCLSRFTLQVCMRSFGSLCSLRMTEWGVIPNRFSGIPTRFSVSRPAFLSSRPQWRDLLGLLPFTFYAAILHEILRFALLSQDDRVGCHTESFLCHPGSFLCHPDRSGGISLVYCPSSFTLQSCIRSFGSLCSLRMTVFYTARCRDYIDKLRN